MKTYDFDDFVPKQEIRDQNNGGNKENNYDFQDFLDYDPLLSYSVINSYYSMRDLLIKAGFEVRTSNMFCPFHEDRLTGKASAKYFEESDSIYCFSENRLYTAYHALKLIYNEDMHKRFIEAWDHIPHHERQKFLAEGDKTKNVKADYTPKIWTQCSVIMGKFKLREVSFKQHKRALLKVLNMIADDSMNKKLAGGG